MAFYLSDNIEYVQLSESIRFIIYSALDLDLQLIQIALIIQDNKRIDYCDNYLDSVFFGNIVT